MKLGINALLLIFAIWLVAFIADIYDWPYHPATEWDARIIQLTGTIINKKNWDKQDDRDCEPEHNATVEEKISLYCALKKASIEVSGDWHHESNVMNAVRKAIQETAPNNQYYQHILEDFNNAPEVNLAKLQQVLEVAEVIVRDQWQKRDSFEQRFYRYVHR